MPALAPNLPTKSNPRAFIDTLLSEERQWSAVDQFSTWHDTTEDRPRSKTYHRLIPATDPGPGQQFSFEVDLDKCSGCKACVVACHSLNGLEETESWRTVGLLVGPPGVQQHVTTACHHCLEPSCLTGCPVLAYEKDPLTGIVRHLDDQCIGCQYCIMKCPYEVPQYSNRLGIVRKCDMCYQRLAVGEAPACAQACPSEAIHITLVETGALRATRSFLPDSPDPSLTLPTTQFISQGLSFDGLKAADHNTLRLEHAHWPLVIMLILSQAAAGLFSASTVLVPNRAEAFPVSVAGLSLLGAALAAAAFHLGKPLRAWRAFLGWRTSWLSREVVALGAFGGFGALAIFWPLTLMQRELATIGCAVLGLLAVATSAMVYVDTGRLAWSARITFTNFFGSTVLLGATLTAAVLAARGEPALSTAFLWTANVLGLVLFVWRCGQSRAASLPSSPLHLNYRIAKELIPWTGKIAGVLFILAIFFGSLAISNVCGCGLIWTMLAALATLISETIGRYMFFVAGANKRMPGGVFA
jgi:Fe-S-cluster-containing dehydrogenase component/DMSO reductase anchor subunit